MTTLNYTWWCNMSSVIDFVIIKLLSFFFFFLFTIHDQQLNRFLIYVINFMDNLIGVLVELRIWIIAIMKIQSVPLDELNSSIYSFQKKKINNIFNFFFFFLRRSIYLTLFICKNSIKSWKIWYLKSHTFHFRMKTITCHDGWYKGNMLYHQSWHIVYSFFKFQCP